MVMEIDVAQQLKEAVGFSRRYQIGDFTEDDQGRFPIQGQVELLRTDRGILVRGTLETKIRAMCSRCLSPFDHPLRLRFEEEFFPLVDVVSGISLPVAEGTGAFTIDESHILDLSEAVRQYVLLATPMKPLCRKDCPGLCPSCGRNLNEGPCGCLASSPDPRWSQLQKLVGTGGLSKPEREGNT
jgi:uncharacterized protein